MKYMYSLSVERWYIMPFFLNADMTRPSSSVCGIFFYIINIFIHWVLPVMKKTPSHLQQHHNNLFLHCFSVGTENALRLYNLLLSYVDDDCEKEPELSLRRFCSSSSMNVVAQTFKRQGGLVINHNINNKPLQMTLTGWRCHVLQCCCYRATNASTRVVMPLRLFEKLKYVQNYDTRGITIVSAHKALI